MTDSQNKKNAYILILIAGSIWGTLGFFCNILGNLGFSPELIAFTRLFSGFIILSLFSALRNFKLLIIDMQGLMFTALAGLVSQTGFNLFYFKAIKIIGVSSSAVLLYLSPLFLFVWSAIFFKESLTLKKFRSLSICILGCFLAVTGGCANVLSSSFIGIGFGIISAIAYSLMSVFSKFLSSKYNSITIIIYSFMFGTLFTLPFMDISEIPIIFSSVDSVFLSIAMGTLTSAIAYILYFKGIASGINLSSVGIISTIELVVSIIFGTLVLNESFNIIKFTGLLFIILSILLINKPVKSSNNKLLRNFT